MKLLCVYLIDDVVYNIYLLVTVLLSCLIYQGVMKIKAKSNMKKMPAKYYVGVYAFRCFKIARACLKNHFHNLQAPLCGIFYLRSVAVARYAALIRINDYK